MCSVYTDDEDDRRIPKIKIKQFNPLLWPEASRFSSSIGVGCHSLPEGGLFLGLCSEQVLAGDWIDGIIRRGGFSFLWGGLFVFLAVLSLMLQLSIKFCVASWCSPRLGHYTPSGDRLIDRSGPDASNVQSPYCNFGHKFSIPGFPVVHFSLCLQPNGHLTWTYKTIRRGWPMLRWFLVFQVKCMW